MEGNISNVNLFQKKSFQHNHFLPPIVTNSTQKIFPQQKKNNSDKFTFKKNVETNSH